MAFFELIPEDQMAPEAKEYIEIVKKRRRSERRIVEFTLRVARDAHLKLDDFHEMERAGFAKDEILEMIGVAAFWNLATTLSTAVNSGLPEE